VLVDEEWVRAQILQDMRQKEGNPWPKKGACAKWILRSVPACFPYFWAFMPVDELDASLGIMLGEGAWRSGQGST